MGEGWCVVGWELGEKVVWGDWGVGIGDFEGVWIFFVGGLVGEDWRVGGWVYLKKWDLEFVGNFVVSFWVYCCLNKVVYIMNY